MSKHIKIKDPVLQAMITSGTYSETAIQQYIQRRSNPWFCQYIFALENLFRSIMVEHCFTLENLLTSISLAIYREQSSVN